MCKGIPSFQHFLGSVVKKSLNTTASDHPLTDISAHNIVLIFPDPLQPSTVKTASIILPTSSEVSSSKVLSLSPCCPSTLNWVVATWSWYKGLNWRNQK